MSAKLNKVDDVNATVDLSTERAHITAPAHVSASDPVAVVEVVGYPAELAVPASADTGFTPMVFRGSACDQKGACRPLVRPVRRWR